ncbi:MAG: hypothetical protein ABW252_18320 [Polyangiales bacterium]
MKRAWMSAASCGGLAIIAMGCGGSGSQDSDDDHHECPPSLSYAQTAKPFVDKYCITCHGAASTDRRAAPRDANFDDLAGLRAHGTMVHTYVQEGRMPPPEQEGLPRPSAQERDTFVEWTVCSGIAGEHSH